MDPGTALKAARRRAGHSQRALSAATGIPQSTIGRIETGAVVPGVSTLDQLLSACGERLEAMPRLGQGVDRSLIHHLLEMTIDQRFEYARGAAAGLAALRGSIHR